MKICRIVDKFPTGKEIIGDLGPNYYHLSKLTAAKGFDMHVICGREKHQKSFEEIDGINVHRVTPIKNLRSILYGKFAQKSLEKVIELNPDIVHGHNIFHIGCIRNRKKINTKIITHLHYLLDMDKYTDKLPFRYSPKTVIYNELISTFLFNINKYVVKNSDYIIAVSRAGANSIKKYYPDKNIKVIYNGIDPSVFHHVDSDIKGELDAKYLLLFVGRPVPWKGVQYLLEATKKLNKKFEGLKVLLLGVDRPDSQVYLRWLKDLSEKHGLDNVIFSEQVPYVELPKYYSAADCFVLPSYPDPSPKVIYEALACGTPIVATDGGGIPELIRGTRNLLVRPKDPNDLAEKLEFVLNENTSIRARDTKIFTWQNSVDEIVKLYNEIYSQ